MKSSDMSIESGTSGNVKETTDVVRTKEKNHVLITILPVLSMVISILPGVINKASGIDIVKIGILTLVLTTVATFYIRLNADNILDIKLAKTIITLGYLGSLGLLLLVPGPENLSFWMLGGVLVAMLIDSKLGLLLHFNLTFIMGITLSLHPEIVIQILIIGVIMSLLAKALKQKATVIYAAIIILSTNITLAFVINNFVFEEKKNYNYMNSLFSILAVLVTAYLINIFYDKVINKRPDEVLSENLMNSSILGTTITPAEKSNSAEELLSKDIITEEFTSANAIENNLLLKVSVLELNSYTDENLDISHNLGTRTSYDVLCDFDNELIQKMKQYSEILYSHSIRIGNISWRAAIEIGANEYLALAGGLYHEIGKINGKNYIEESLIIAEDYAFPKELKAILKEHNIKYEKPSSVEAVIVMLSDNIVSTIDYIEKTGDKKFTTNKIIDNIFQMRMDKGTFDMSSLSLKDFIKLKEFYQKEFNSNTKENE
ncbi:MAG: HD domain-containing protein [Mobilitalea sp.]